MQRLYRLILDERVSTVVIADEVCNYAANGIGPFSVGTMMSKT